MAENRKLKLFLCHSKDDKPKVRELYHRLVADGFDAWLDEENLLPGQDWDLEIRKAVRESDVVVVCLSKGAVTKTGYVQKEIRFSLDVADEQPEGTIFIIPAKLEACQVPLRLNKWQWVNLFETVGYEKLKRSLTHRANNLGNLVIPILYLQGSSSKIVEPQMINISAGKFLMGSSPKQVEQAIRNGANKFWVEWEQPQVEVELSRYSIGKYPITNYEYSIFIKDTAHKPPRGWNEDQYPPEKGDHPVVNVSWDDAIAYCSWLSKLTGKNYSLPTEAQWEKAARGTNGNIWPWGNEFSSNRANTKELNIGTTTSVGKFSPHGDSSYGCSDMSGNVWEWCSDKWQYDSSSKISKSSHVSPQENNFMVRGGSYNRSSWEARCATHRANKATLVGEAKGFRVALSPILKSEP